jgi:hypothetical protein
VSSSCAADNPPLGGGARLVRWIAEEVRRPVHPAVAAAAEEVRRRHPLGAVAVLFYGSCLRQRVAADDAPEGVVDFYLLVDRYRNAYRGRLPALANAVLPPNVFYIEFDWRGRRVRAKYAVVALSRFRRGTSRRGFHPWLWARFAQPSRLVYARDAAARAVVTRAVADAVVTTVARAAPLLDGGAFSAADLWVRAFAESYRTELRAERPERARQIYEADRERYDRLTSAALVAAGLGWPRPLPGGRLSLPAAAAPSAARRGLARTSWAACRVVGKTLSVARLIKAVFTFQGGADYILWKIERHTGARPTVTAWQRRHPLLGCPVLLWRLYRRGMVR